MSCTIGLVRESEEGRTWTVWCKRCKEVVVTVKLPYGKMEEWLMGLTICPSGKHSLPIPGKELRAEGPRGLRVEKAYEKENI